MYITKCGYIVLEGDNNILLILKEWCPSSHKLLNATYSASVLAGCTLYQNDNILFTTMYNVIAVS